MYDVTMLTPFPDKIELFRVTTNWPLINVHINYWIDFTRDGDRYRHTFIEEIAGERRRNEIFSFKINRENTGR